MIMQMNLKEEGKTIVLISEVLDEGVMMSDRVTIMYDGKIINVVTVKEATKEKIGSGMLGGD